MSNKKYFFSYGKNEKFCEIEPSRNWKKNNWIHLNVWIDGIWFQHLTINATLFLEELRMNFDRNVDRSF